MPSAWPRTLPTLPKRPVRGDVVDLEQVGYVLAALAVLDQLLGMGYLLRRKFRLASEFRAPALRGLHYGAGPFAYYNR